MPFNQQEKKSIDSYLKLNLEKIKVRLKTGSTAAESDKEENYTIMKEILAGSMVAKNGPEFIKELAGIVSKKLTEATKEKIPVVVQVVEPKAKANALTKMWLHEILRDPGYKEEIDGVTVCLDFNQNKHQPIKVPIGGRDCAKGALFGDYATKDWHKRNTMKFMVEWTKKKNPKEGEKIGTKQSERFFNADKKINISYEGDCAMIDGKLYASFHCYPNNN